MLDLLTAVQDWVLSLAGSPWILLAVAALAVIDGIFPPVPSETVVIAVAALSVAGDGPPAWLLVVVAAGGAWCGDLVAYSLGARLPRHRLLSSRRAQASLAWASTALRRRGATLVIAARFVPGGRIAVNAAAGAAGYPFRRFLAVDAVATLLWASFSTLIGLGAGAVLGDRPLLAAAVGTVAGVVVGVAVDKLAAALPRRRATASSAAPSAPRSALPANEARRP